MPDLNLCGISQACLDSLPQSAVSSLERDQNALKVLLEISQTNQRKHINANRERELDLFVKVCRLASDREKNDNTPMGVD